MKEKLKEVFDIEFNAALKKGDADWIRRCVSYYVLNYIDLPDQAHFDWDGNIIIEKGGETFFRIASSEVDTYVKGYGYIRGYKLW